MPTALAQKHKTPNLKSRRDCTFVKNNQKIIYKRLMPTAFAQKQPNTHAKNQIGNVGGLFYVIILGLHQTMMAT